MNGSTRKLMFLIPLLFLSAGALSAQRTMSVTVKEAEVRSSPSFLGTLVATLPYGDSVRVRKEQGSWVQIDIPDGRERGWVHASALEMRRILFAASTDDVATEATSGEIALAGKGFNKEVEEKFIEATSLDFSRIDAMEEYTVPTESIRDLIDDGGLNDIEGDE